MEKESLKFVFVHLFGAVIVGLIGYAIFTRGGPAMADFISEWIGHEHHAEFAILILVGFLMYYVVRWPDDVLRYVWFLGTEERRACGLYIEGYFAKEHGKTVPVISLIVVSFDVRAEQLKITGYAFDQDEGSKPTFKRRAKWESRALYFKPMKDECDIFYIHEGDLEDKRGLRGTTTFYLPSPNLRREGCFCDLTPANVGSRSDNTMFEATNFDIVRASKALEREFCGKIGGLISRWQYRMKLSCPTERVFCEFVEAQRREMLKDGGGRMDRVRKELKA
jgi:hypothetical protein